MYLVQQIINPIWKIYLGGCQIIRDTKSEIEKIGFSDVNIHYIEIPSILYPVVPHVYGTATK